MNKETFKTLINLNNNFYKYAYKDFSVRRTVGNKGWEKIIYLVKLLASSRVIRILDLACGNGRFLGELYKQGMVDENIIYFGVDNNRDMINMARSEYDKKRNINFELFDVIGGINSMSYEYDVIVAFGLLHHIPSKKYRNKWLHSLSRILNKGGVLALSIWNFLKYDKFLSKNLEVSEICNILNLKKGSVEVEEGDYFLGRDDNNRVFRYCHYYNLKEKKMLITLLRKKGIILIDKYLKDNYNQYFIFRR